ncbi:MAG: hypothetical protein QOK15_24 [Nocardioidaceae bacterium]|nr:hypothetical protein [Nocardioidaceae bacterium]
MASHAASAARPDEIRQHNLSLVLNHVHRFGNITRAQLTKRLRLSRSTVAALVGDLKDLGLVEEQVPSGRTTVGRPSYLVGPARAGPYTVAVDIDMPRVTIAAIGLGGVVLTRDLVTVDGGALSPERLVECVAERVRTLHGILPEARLCGVGLSVPGTVDLATGRIGVAPNLGWEEVELGALLGRVVPEGVRVVAGNDADLAVLAEHRRGSARDADDVVYLLGRVGVGGGIIAGGVPLRGRDGHAGEIGHNVLDPTGPRCHCGQRGCVETYIGDAALLTAAGRPGAPSAETMAGLFAAAQTGDAAALRAVRGGAEPLGRTIAALLNTLNSERVVLGGSLCELLELARSDVEGFVTAYSFGRANRDVRLVPPALGKDSSLLGAAEIAFADLLAHPR